MGNLAKWDLTFPTTYRAFSPVQCCFSLHQTIAFFPISLLLSTLHCIVLVVRHNRLYKLCHSTLYSPCPLSLSSSILFLFSHGSSLPIISPPYPYLSPTVSNSCCSLLMKWEKCQSNKCRGPSVSVKMPFSSTSTENPTTTRVALAIVSSPSSSSVMQTETAQK